MEYRSIINGIGLAQIKQSVDIPDYHLMVGTAECLDGLPLYIYGDYMPIQTATVLPDVEKMTYEDVQQDLASGKLTINDFFQNVYPLGNAIEK